MFHVLIILCAAFSLCAGKNFFSSGLNTDDLAGLGRCMARTADPEAAAGATTAPFQLIKRLPVTFNNKRLNIEAYKHHKRPVLVIAIPDIMSLNMHLNPVNTPGLDGQTEAGALVYLSRAEDAVFEQTDLDEFIWRDYEKSGYRTHTLFMGHGLGAGLAHLLASSVSQDITDNTGLTEHFCRSMSVLQFMPVPYASIRHVCFKHFKPTGSSIVSIESSKCILPMNAASYWQPYCLLPPTAN